MSNSEIIKYLSIIKNLCSLTSEQIDRLQESLNIQFEKLRQMLAEMIGSNKIYSVEFERQLDDVLEAYYTKRIAINKLLNYKGVGHSKSSQPQEYKMAENENSEDHIQVENTLSTLT